MYATIVAITNITSNIIAEYDTCIIAYTNQQAADIIPINLILLSDLLKNELNVIRHAKTGNNEYIFSYDTKDITPNTGSKINTSIFFFFSSSENKYISINIINPNTLHTVPVNASNKK